MLRITVHNEEQATRLVIEGELAEPGVEELRKCWKQVVSSPSLPVLVNLTDLTGIDSAGKELLAQMHRQGARLIGTGVMVEALIAEIDRSRDEQNFGNH